MTFAAIAAAAWLVVGCLVAAFAVPWGDVQFHARRFLPMRFPDGEAPRSPGAGLLFFLVAAILWPVAWRWRRLGYFQGTGEQPLEQLPAGAGDDLAGQAARNAAHQLLQRRRT